MAVFLQHIIPQKLSPIGSVTPSVQGNMSVTRHVAYFEPTKQLLVAQNHRRHFYGCTSVVFSFAD